KAPWVQCVSCCHALLLWAEGKHTLQWTHLKWRYPCKYRVNNQNDITTMCWGRGPCPASKCSQQILETDGWRVTARQSSRYQLEGTLAQGDVSLTIANVAEADGGVYCCRVEIPGWFNDELNNLEVVIEKGEQSFFV
uniref:Immunoglobulin V-set domain-containing protein n=1 Tax=Pelusios castaneus TaxID=367368 RepID=A0A8C8RYS8_9SAUR